MINRYSRDGSGNVWDEEHGAIVSAGELMRAMNDYDALRTELERVTQQRDEYENKCKALDTLLAQSQTERYEVKQQRDEAVKALEGLLNYWEGDDQATTRGWMARYREVSELLTRIKEQP